MATVNIDMDEVLCQIKTEVLADELKERRKIVEMHRKEFIHQCRMAQPINYENNTSNQ